MTEDLAAAFCRFVEEDCTRRVGSPSHCVNGSRWRSMRVLNCSNWPATPARSNQ